MNAGAAVRLHLIVTPQSIGRITNNASVSCAETELSTVNNNIVGTTRVFSPTFLPAGDLNLGRYQHASTLLANGKVLITGGIVSTGYTATTEIYDPVANTFIWTASMDVPRHAHTATRLDNGLVLIVGTSSTQPRTTSSQLYDPLANAFTNTGSLIYPRNEHTATLLPNGKVLIAGGTRPGDYHEWHAELYDPATGTFTEIERMQYPRGLGTAVGFTNGDVVFVGGFTAGSLTEIFRHATISFESTGSALYNLWEPQGLRLPDGRAFIVGGATDFYGMLAATQFYDPGTGKFTPGPNLQSRRYRHTTSQYAPGKVLVAGGWEYPTLSSAEVFDVGTGAFTNTVNLQHAREWHAATVLSDGRVLITGGHEGAMGGTNILATAEIFDATNIRLPPMVTIANAALTEMDAGATNLTFNLQLSAPMGVPVSVAFATAAGPWYQPATAAGDEDYVTTNGVVVFAPGTTNQTLAVTVIGDGDFEGDEFFYVSLLAATNASLASTQGVATIFDNDPVPAIFLDSSEVAEGNLQTASLILPIRLSARSVHEIQVSFVTSNGTALAGSDYITTNGVLTFPPGTTNQSIAINVNGDISIETSEHFFVVLSGELNATLGNVAAVGTIINDDGLPGVLDHFEITLPSAPRFAASPLTFTIHAKDATGAPATNFNGRVLLSVGTSDETPQYFDFESATLEGWTPSNGGQQPGPYEVKLFDVNGDGDTSMAFRTAAGLGVDGITRPVSLQFGRRYYLSVDFAQSNEGSGPNGGGTAAHLTLGGTTLASCSFGGVNNGDVLRSNLLASYVAPYTGDASLGLLFQRDPWFQLYNIGAFADDAVLSAAPITPRWTAHFTNGVWSGVHRIEGTGSDFVLHARGPEGHRGQSGVFALEQLANVAVSTAVAPATPRVGADLILTLTVANAGPGPAPEVVLTNLLPVGTWFISATSAVGACTISNELVRCELGALTAGQTANITLTLRPVMASVVTNFAGLVPTVYDPFTSNNTVTTAITIQPALALVQNATVTEAAGGTNAVFTVIVGGPHSDAITVDYATLDVTATNGVDYVGAVGQLSFPPGVNTQLVSVSVLDDLLAEVNETFRLQLSNPTNASLSGNGFGTATILDNGDPLPEVTINDVATVEGDSGLTNAAFTVSLSRVAGYNVTLNYATTNGTANSTNDYIATSGFLTFTAGQTNKTVVVPVRGNTVNEPDEVFYVSVTTNRQGGGPVLLSKAQGVGTILNDDLVPGRLDHFDWTVSVPRVVGLPFLVTLTARDAFNNTATNALGSIPISATALVGGKQSGITISPASTTPFSTGVWNGNITINAMYSNVVLRADDGQEHVGLSDAFDVLPLIATTLLLPPGTNENAGVLVGQGRLAVSLPRNGDTIFNLTSSDTTELAVPATVVLPANATNVAFTLTVVDDAILDGTKYVTITASSTGYLTTNAQFAVSDNELAALSLAAPSNTTETVSLSGTVFLSAPAGDEVAVSLASSDPTQLTGPATVMISAGQTSNTFTITPVNDLRLDGPQTVLLTASVDHWTNGVTAVTVLDDETNTVTISFAPPGATYYEGSGPVSNATIQLGGIVDTNVTVALNSSDQTEAAVTESVLVPAGTNSVFLPLIIPDDAIHDGTQTALLTPTAPGFASLPVTVTVPDNELHHFDLSALPGSFEAGVAVPFTISARDINNAVMTLFPVEVTLTATNASGVVPMSPPSVTLTAGQWSGNLVFPNWEYGGVRVVVSSGGVAAQSTAFNVTPPTLSLVYAGGSDIAYSPMNGRLYVNASGGWVTPVNAAQAQVETAFYLGSLGPRMVASDDGQFLYFERTGGNLSRYNLSANTQDLYWNAGAPQIGDLAAVPGMPTAVVIVRYDPYYSTPSRGTVMFNNGVALPNGAGGSAIDFDPVRRRLYCYDGETTAFGTGIYEVNSNGLAGIKSVAMMSGFHVNFVCRGGLLFTTSGQIFNPDRAIVIGGNPGGLTIAGDSAEGRFYYWQNLGGGQSAIVAADLHTLHPIGSTLLPGVSTATGSLIRWGTNGLAFRPNASQVAIVRSSWVPAGAPADLVLTQTSASGPALVGGNYVCTFAISNAGPGFATNVVLTATLPATVSSLTAASSLATNIATYGWSGVPCALPSLASGATATVTLTFTPTKPGPFGFKVGVLSSAPDLNLANNRMSLDAPAVFITGYDSVVELALTANDLAYDSVRDRLCASVPNASELLGNAIVTFDPLSAFYPPLISTAVEPVKLAVADNGQYLYAALGSEASIQRVDLNARVADLKFPTGYGGVYDMEVMPGNAGVVAATVHTTVAVYENGVRRTNVVAPTEYNFGYNLEFGAGSNRLYASFPRGFRRLAVDSNGVTLIDDVRDALIASYDYDFDFNAGFCYTIDGRVFDPETKTMVTTVPYNGLAVADAATGRAYYLTTANGVGTIHVLDMPSLTRIKTITIPGVGYAPASFIRWGADGLAFRTTGGQVFLIRDTAVNDHDWDGLNDAWETQYFGSINGAGGGVNEDPDGDALTNFDEFRAGTIPTDAASHLRIAAVRTVGAQHRVTFATATGRRYRIERRLTLQPGGWTIVADNVPGTGGTVEITDPATENRTGFYRLVLLP